MNHDQAERLRRQMERSTNMNQTKTISFVSGKGGVGKSNIAVNFSIELCKEGFKVLLIDLDIGMGNIEIILGLQAKKTIVDLMQDQLPIYDIMEMGPNNLMYIAGGSGFTNIFSVDHQKMDYFLSQYEKVVSEFDYIIFDMGAGATTESIEFVLASDECIVITTTEPTSITDAYSMIKYIIGNKKTMPIYFVLNRADNMNKGKITAERFQRLVLKFLDIDIKLLGVLPEDKTVSRAVITQAPFSIANTQSSIAKSIKQLAKTYQQNNPDVIYNETTTFVDRLKRFLRNKGR